MFCWELGANFGYISQFLPFARELKERGHEVVLAVRELHQVRDMMTDTGIPVMQAPLWLPTVRGLPEPPLNYAEILLRYGYHDPKGLVGIVNAWRALLKVCRADLVVTSHAPTALLAARTLGLRAAVLGTGFAAPPKVAPTPNMRDWIKVPEDRLISSDAIVLKSINTILAACGQPQLLAVSELFDVAENFLCTLPELDHYAQRTGGCYWGAVTDAKMGQVAEWPTGEGDWAESKRIFVYLEHGHRDFRAVVNALVQLKCRALICAPGIAENLIKSLETPHILISGKPFNFKNLLADCDLALCHTGHGTTSLMMMAGVPMLMFPNHLEQYLLALRVKNLGAGEVVNLEQSPPDFVELLKKMLSTMEYRLNAKQFSSRHQDFSPETQLLGIVARIEEIAGE